MAVVPSLIVLVATLTSMQLNDVLMRAESHARERPQQTLALYQQYNDSFGSVPMSVRFRWYFAAAQAAIFSNNFSQARDLIDSLLALDDPKAQQLSRSYNLLGIWLKKNHLLTDAEHAYQCAFTTESRPIYRAIYLNNMLIVARHRQSYQLAQSYYDRAAAILQAHPNDALSASLANNMGMLRLSLGDIKGAVGDFRKATFLKEQHNLALSQLNAAMNLTLALLLNEQSERGARLLADIDALVAQSADPDRHTLAAYLHAMLDKQQHQPVRHTEQQLRVRCTHIKDDSLAQLVRYSADYLNLSLPARTVHQGESASASMQAALARCQSANLNEHVHR